MLKWAGQRAPWEVWGTLREAKPASLCRTETTAPGLQPPLCFTRSILRVPCGKAPFSTEPKPAEPVSPKMWRCFTATEGMKISMCVVVLFLRLLLEQITFNMGEKKVQTFLFKEIYYFKCIEESLSPLLALLNSTESEIRGKSLFASCVLKLF